MPRRKLLTGFLLTVGSLAGTVFYRRRVARRRERVDIYYEDGSMVSVTEDSADAESLFPLAREILQASQP